jgi:hypothetical protein
MKKDVSIGVDIGIKGAIAIVYPKGLHHMSTVFDTPTVKIRTEKKNTTDYDIKTISHIMGEYKRIQESDDGINCFIESNLIIPKGFDIRTNVKLARCFGIFEGVAVANGMSPIGVNPNIWHAYFGISSKKGDIKQQSIELAKKLFPYIEFKTKRGRILDGRADALLIAEYGRRTNE